MTNDRKIYISEKEMKIIEWFKNIGFTKLVLNIK